jgi:hypothetical protein
MLVTKFAQMISEIREHSQSGLAGTILRTSASRSYIDVLKSSFRPGSMGHFKFGLKT